MDGSAYIYININMLRRSAVALKNNTGRRYQSISRISGLGFRVYKVYLGFRVQDL